MDYKIRNRIWIDGPDGTFLGNGRIELLSLINKTGSINEAAKKLNMSYRKAWNLIDSMNKQAPSPVVKKSQGGSGGGGSEVTELGMALLKRFDELREKCDALLKDELKNWDFNES